MDEKNFKQWIISSLDSDENYLKSKREVLKLLGMIGIDTRFISYTSKTIYINNIRFSKFSKKRQITFEKYFPEIAIFRSTLFQKICTRASKVLAEELSPRDNVLLLKPQNKKDEILKIILEPYSRKYGINIFESNFKTFDEAIFYLNEIKDDKIDIDLIASSLILDEKVESILSNIFSGKGIIRDEKINYNNLIHPFINVSNDWINFLEIKYKLEDKLQSISENKENNDYIDIVKKNKHDNENYILNKEGNSSDQIAISFMDFIEDIIPQFKENILKSSIFIEKYFDNEDIKD